MTENVDFDLDTLDTYVKATYPDLRKCLNTVQMNSQGGKLLPPHGDENTNSVEWRITVIDLFKRGKVKQARTLLCESARPEEMEEIFRWMYDNLELWGDDDSKQDQAVLIIKQGLVNHSFCADPEINLAATLIELANIE